MMKTDNETGRTPAVKRRRLIAAGMVVLIAGVTAVIWPKVNAPSRQTLTPPVDLPQYYVLSPTNGVLKQYLVVEGEMVAESAHLAQVGDADYEQHVRDARAAVAKARLAVEEARLEALAHERTAEVASGNLAALDRSKAKQDEQAIREQERHVRQLGIAVTTAQAKLVKLRAQPFGLDGDAGAIDAAAAEVTRLQSKLDVATIELKQRRERAATRMGETSGAATAPPETTATSRRVGSATEALQHKQAELDAILAESMHLVATVQAPFDGQIIRRIHPEGSFVREGQPLIVLMRQP